MRFLPPLLVLCGVLGGASAAGSAPTYEHVDPRTSQTLRCDKCPPGTHMVRHCTASAPTECKPCGSDHYTELWNFLPACLYCNNFCAAQEELEAECSPLNNRVCRCKEGFYSNYDFCFRHTECQPGYGVLTKGTSRNNTVCEMCPRGYFSNSTSALEPCVKHRPCTPGLLQLLPGSAFHGPLCGSCRDLRNGGKLLGTYVSRLFTAYRMSVSKMRRFVQRNVRNSVERFAGDVSQERDSLLDQMKTWALQASVEELKNLPVMLRASRLYSTARKMEKRLQRLERQSLACNSAN